MSIKAKRHRDEVLKAALQGNAEEVMTRWETLDAENGATSSSQILDEHKAWLAEETDGWTSPVFTRTYKQDQNWLINFEARLLLANGYELQSQSTTGSHVNIGRTVAGATLTGGLSLLFGGSRSRSTISILYTKNYQTKAKARK